MIIYVRNKDLDKVNNVPNDGLGEIVSEFINICGSEGDHQAAEAVQGGHAEPALRGQVWLHEGGGEHVGVPCNRVSFPSSRHSEQQTVLPRSLCWNPRLQILHLV